MATGHGLLPAALALGAMLAVSTQAAMFRPVRSPGGINAQSNTILSIAGTVTNATGGTNVILRVRGLQAPYDVQMAPLGTSNWSHGAFMSLKWPNHTGGVTVSNVAGATQFRLNLLGLTNYGGRYVDYTNFAGISNVFVGAVRCHGCHSEIINEWQGTAHATAINALRDPNGAISASNMQHGAVYRSVGYGQPGGFIDLTNTPQLANVGCEACHGPANAHLYISGRQYHPVATVAAELCGGCHTGTNHPPYEEWTNSLHAAVTEHVQEYFLDPDPATGRARQMSCGPCHSAASRLALLSNYRDLLRGSTNAVVLPEAGDAADFGVACGVCHDPHTVPNRAQLRNPIFSTNFFTYFAVADSRTNYSTNVFGTVTANVYYLNTAFATQYVAGVQICAQCHNSRGALWTDTSRPPHDSPQYNILIGTVQPGYLNGTANEFGPHGLMTNGCTQCHMETIAGPAPKLGGHDFQVRLGGCVASDCHTSTNVAAAFTTALQLDTTARIQQVVDLLNQWGTNKAPAVLRTNYGRYSWEYTTAGRLSNPTGTNTMPGTTNLIAGPSSAGQAAVPDAIKKARFNLYLVENDHSQGVHNKTYTRFLLNDAKTNVQLLLGP